MYILHAKSMWSRESVALFTFFPSHCHHRIEWPNYSILCKSRVVLFNCVCGIYWLLHNLDLKSIECFNRQLCCSRTVFVELLWFNFQFVQCVHQAITICKSSFVFNSEISSALAKYRMNHNSICNRNRRVCVLWKTKQHKQTSYISP